MNAAPPLYWYCWIHDSPEDCGKSCQFGYWLCPECKTGMESDDEKPRPYKGVWRCPNCETFIDFDAVSAPVELRPSVEER